jgi:predicted Zn-dependent protease
MPVQLIKISPTILISLLLTSCASIDKGLMSTSNAVSSIDPVTGNREINLESETKEIARASTQTADILAAAREHGKKVDAETEHFDRVEEIFNRLRGVVHRRHLPWEIHVVEDERFNAFTMGGGKVFINTGLIDSEQGVKTDDELAAVIAHEMAHVTARHASEAGGKLGLAMLADKDLRTDTFKASFTTNQEDEADKYSVIYSALAGYDPSAAVDVWQRMDAATGSNASNLLFTHPLNDDRAKNIQEYSSLAMQYYQEGYVNGDFTSILKSNAVFSYHDRDPSSPKAGDGGGALALLETLGNAFSEVMEAKAEQRERKLKQMEQQRIASTQLLFREVKIGKAQSGGKAIFGYAVNATGKNIENATVSIKYWLGSKLVYEDKSTLKMKPYERRKFGISLKPISYSGVTISPEYVHLSE